MKQGSRPTPHLAAKASVRTALAVLATAGLLTACAGGPRSGLRAAAPAYKVGSTGRALSAAAASRDPAVIRRAEARAARAAPTSRAAAGYHTRAASRAAPPAGAHSRRVATNSHSPSNTHPAAPTATAPSVSAAVSAPAPSGASAAPESVAAQRVVLQGPRAAAITPAPALATAPFAAAWSERLWLLAAFAVLALAALAAWVLRPRRHTEDLVPASRVAPVAANDPGEPARRPRRLDPPPPAVTILAAR